MVQNFIWGGETMQGTYRTRALLGAPACISTRSKWVPNKEPAPINENRLVSFIEMTTFTSARNNNYCNGRGLVICLITSS